MEIESLSCNNCGAPLGVPASANFVTCGYCGSRLAVRRTGNAHYTELLERLEQQTERLEDQIAYLRARDDLEALDADWQSERRRHLMRGRNGELVTPTRTYLFLSVLVAVVACLLTIVWFYATASAGDAASFFGWIGAIISFATLLYVARANRQVNSYNAAKHEYQERRDEVLARIYQAYPQELQQPEQLPTADREHQPHS